MKIGRRGIIYFSVNVQLSPCFSSLLTRSPLSSLFKPRPSPVLRLALNNNLPPAISRRPQRSKDRSAPEMVNWLKSAYLERIVPAFLQEFPYKNVYQVPAITKVLVNCSLEDATLNASSLDASINDMTLFTGQKPIKNQPPIKARAKSAISSFRMKANQPLGLTVTLRNNAMWSFLDRLVNLGLSRPYDFQAVSTNSFDGRGNYRIGINDQTIFPALSELGYDSYSKQRVMNVSIETTAPTDKEAHRLLSLLGMPFPEGVGPAPPMVRKKKVGPRNIKGGKYKPKAR